MKRNTVPKVIRLALTIALLSTGTTIAKAQSFDDRNQWKIDCVGRMQLSLPDEVDVSATTLIDDKRRNWSPPPSSFVDGQMSWETSLQFLGRIEVLHGLTQATQKSYVTYRAKILDKLRGESTYKQRQSSLFTSNGFSYELQGRRFLVLPFGNEVFNWEGFSGISEKEAQHNYEVITSGVRRRESFDVPLETGVCLPYAFIRDDGTNGRHIAMTYRLKAHPDMTIYLKDMDAAKAGPDQSPDKFTAEYGSQYFWTYYCRDCKSKSVKRFTLHRHTSLAGQPAIETIGDLVRKDGTEDFGYLVVAKGNADAKEDTPDLMLYVMRDAANARAKGIEPIAKEEFFKMARDIAASVKRRPVRP